MKRLFQAVMFAHDEVATKTFVASLPDIPHEVDEDDDAAVKIIQLCKSFTEPLVRIVDRIYQLFITYFL